jgi:hypothetical protein
MKCEHCQKAADGRVEIRGTLVLHEDCAPAFRAALRGLHFRCPLCNGSGWEYKRDVPTSELYDPVTVTMDGEAR